MPFSEKVAFFVTERRGLMWSVVALIVVASLTILIAFLRLDTEVLNLLPRGFDSVEGLKTYNSEFAQTRELTFALLCQPEDVDKLEEFAPKFVERLRAQPWCVRVLAGSPMETPDGVRDLQRIAVPLLLNLEPEDFDRAVSLLQPQKIQERLAQLRREIESGSPRPEIELTLDPLGLIMPSLKPFAGNAAMETDQPLTSSDSTMRVFPTVTNQPTISAFDCQKLMKQVNAFRATALEGWDGGKLEVLITGRSAYVAEISLSMRHDIVVTVLSSIALVGAVFFYRFPAVVAAPRDGIFPAALLPDRACRRPADFSSAKYDHGRLLRDSGWPGRRFRDSDLRTLSAVTKPRGRTSHGNCRRRSQSWPCGFFWRAYDSGWFPCTRLE